MTKLSILAIVFITACATGSTSTGPVSPHQRSEAVGLYLSGATDEEIATKLALQPDEAREVVHGAILELNRKFYRR